MHARPAATDADVRLVEALAVRVSQLEAAVADLRRRRARIDPPLSLLPAIARTLGATVFTATDLRAHAAQDAELQQALGPATTTRRIGRWLQCLHARRDGAYTLERIGRTAAGALWTLHVSGASHTGAGLRGAPGGHSRP